MKKTQASTPSRRAELYRKSIHSYTYSRRFALTLQKISESD